VNDGMRLDFDIYGRIRLQIIRDNDAWVIFRLRDGRRTPYFDLAIPPEMEPDEIHRYLDDMYHEGSRPGQDVARLTDGSEGHSIRPPK
jgi:hypothetical protein